MLCRTLVRTLTLVLHACATPISTVRIGGLFPRFRMDGSKDLSGIRRFVAFVQAIREINNKTDGVADHLLPSTRIEFTHRDSKRDGATTFFEARALATTAFGGRGVHAVVGAASSGPSGLAALALADTATPQISYSSTSATLSDGLTYPYFARTPPSDAFQAAGLAELAFYLFNYSRIATVASTDTYGSSGISAFMDRASALGITILASVSIVSGTLEFGEQFEALRRSGARVILLFCGTHDASRFIEGAYDVGLGGAGYMWLGSDAVSNPETMSRVADPERRLRIFKGFVGMTPSARGGSPLYQAYARRRRALPSTAGSSMNACSLEVDDEARLLWAADHDANASTPLECAGSDHQEDGTYAPYAYDATFALAHALHELIEVRQRTVVDGAELYQILTGIVSFEGVTGQIDFHDSSSDPTRHAHGDRTVGVQCERRRHRATVPRLLPAPPPPTDSSPPTDCEWSARVLSRGTLLWGRRRHHQLRGVRRARGGRRVAAMREVRRGRAPRDERAHHLLDRGRAQAARWQRDRAPDAPRG